MDRGDASRGGEGFGRDPEGRRGRSFVDDNDDDDSEQVDMNDNAPRVGDHDHDHDDGVHTEQRPDRDTEGDGSVSNCVGESNGMDLCHDGWGIKEPSSLPWAAPPLPSAPPSSYVGAGAGVSSAPAPSLDDDEDDRGGATGGSAIIVDDAQRPTDRDRYESARAARIDESDGGAAVAMECPVCIDTIPPEQLAMRCAGDGGLPHYFHAGCLRQWARASGGDLAAVRCPVCRGAIQVNAERLERMLAQPSNTGGLQDEDRSFFQRVVERASELGKAGWADLADVLTVDNVVAAIGVVGAFGHGFWIATRDRYHSPLSDELMLGAFEAMTPQARAAHVAGLAFGFSVRVASYLFFSSSSSSRAGGDDECDDDCDDARRRRRGGSHNR